MKDIINEAQWTLDVKARILPVYEKIFDIEFPLPKLDTLLVCLFLVYPIQLRNQLLVMQVHDYESGEYYYTF